jgi:hypothetical protein
MAESQGPHTTGRRTAVIAVVAVAAFGGGIAAGVLVAADGGTREVHAAAPAASTDVAEHEAEHHEPTADDHASEATASEPQHDHAARDVDTVWADATSDERAAATALLEATRAASARYADVNVALADGFRPNPRSSGVGMVHYPHSRNRRDGEALDPGALEGLVYHVAPDGRMALAGALFTASRGPLPPAPGGAITTWHSHVPGCAHPADTPSCAGQVPMYMLHVWLLDGVQDPFADNLRAGFGGSRAAVRAALAAALPSSG